MALPGISNANEFYSAHYLESVLTNDIKKVRERWSDEARSQLEADPSATITTPDARFRALRKPWQKLREAELGITGEPAERLRLQRQLFFQPLCEALGYPFAPKAEPVLIGGEAYQIPLLGEVTNAKGEPWLWLVECFNPSDEPADPLELTIATSWACQIDDPALGTVLTGADGQGSETWEELISERVFGQEIPPRWVLAVSRDQLLLIDRQKWAASRLLRFELNTLLGETNPDALLAAATLLHREHTCPTGGGTPLLDELDENSHKHAYEVSGDLKYALRRSIELLGNEVVAFIKARKKGVFAERLDPAQLTLELLRFMYRLLFLFFIESRHQELGYAPMGNDVFRLGYSLESLRDLDTAELATEEDREGTYISDSLDRLFQMIWEGYPKKGDDEAMQPELEGNKPEFDTFRIVPLRSHLFDPERLPILNGLLKDEKGEKRWPKVRFRNAVLREVIELMSLTREGKGKRRGRVSYSQLGINQLGAVYEALLSFRGFFAEVDLYEVQPAPKKAKAAASDDDDAFDGDDEDDNDSPKASGQQHDELEVGHFVTAEQLKAYKAEEIVPDPDTGKPKCYPKGSFIYRLAGRDREKSASYYTPESLTQCLVKYALKELLPGKSAADILQLKVCEPAMGSAAFLNEVVNQLAQKYLELRQQETGKSIPHEQFATELQKVKMRLADQNVFGVDLNPVAVELAEVSLWLNSIFTPENGRAFVPWFSQQLVCGNSLIGARRQIYRVSQLPTGGGRKAKPSKLWHEHAPEELPWDAELPEDGIFHFLLPDPGMAAYTDKVIKELEPDAIERCKRWNKAFVGEAFTEAQIAHLLRLSKLVDALWKEWAQQQTQLRQRTTDPLPVWEDPTGAQDGDWTPLKLKDRIQEQEVLGRDVANTNPRLRLKWAMDYWVALWFWPIRQAGSLPSRDSWLLELSMILGDLEQGVTLEPGQGNLFAETQPAQLAVDFSDRHGYVNVQRLKLEFERLRLLESITQEIRPVHWELEFADVFLSSESGFHLVIGNPPWIGTDWNKGDLLSEFMPEINIRNWRATQVNLAWKKIASTQATHAAGIKAIEIAPEQLGIATFLGSPSMNRAISTLKTDLYKGFIVLMKRITGRFGATGILHPPGIYRESGGEALRAELLPSMKYIFQFENQLREIMFRDIGNTRKYAISISSESIGSTGPTKIISNLFHPSTIDRCFHPDSSATSCPGIKENGEWCLRGHPDRVIRRPASGDCISFIHSTSVERVENIIAQSSSKISDLLGQELMYIKGVNQAAAEENAYIERKSCFPRSLELTMLSPRHVGLGSPFQKAPKRICNSHRAYEVVNPDLLARGDIPRTLFQITSKGADQRRSWDVSTRFNSRIDLKILFNEMVDPSGQRSLLACLMPTCASHTDLLSGLVANDAFTLVEAASGILNILSDLGLRISGSGHIKQNELSLMPIVRRDSPRFLAVAQRILHLHRVLKCYGVNLPEELASPEGKAPIPWSQGHPTALRDFNEIPSDFSRRLALIELDVLVALEVGIKLNDLISSVSSCFPVLIQYEEQQAYDSSGRIAFTTDKSLSGIGFPRKRSKSGPGWEDVRGKTDGIYTVFSIDDSMPGGPIDLNEKYTAPFFRSNRSNDYRIAWRHFEANGLGG